MKVSLWRRGCRLPSSRPESSSCRSAPSLDGSTSGAALLLSGFRHAARHLVLLCLPLLAGLAGGAQAQGSPVFSSSTILEGQTKTITVTGIPNDWTGTPIVSISASGNTGSIQSSDCSSSKTTDPALDVCLDDTSPTWDSTTRTVTFTLTAFSDSRTEGGEGFRVTVTDSDASARSVGQDFTVSDPPSPAFSSSTILEGQTKTITVTHIPYDWTGTPIVSISASGNTGSIQSSDCSSSRTTDPALDVCLDDTSPTWDSTTRTVTFTLTAFSDSRTEGGEGFRVTVTDSDASARSVGQDFTVSDPHTVRAVRAFYESRSRSVFEGTPARAVFFLDRAAADDVTVKVRARRADGVILSSDVPMTLGARLGGATFTNTEDAVSPSLYYDMPVWVEPGDGYSVLTNITRAHTEETIRMIDNDTPVRFSVFLSSSNVVEGKTTAGVQETMLLSLFGSRGVLRGETITIPFTFTGATLGTDFTLELSNLYLREQIKLDAAGTLTLTGPLPPNFRANSLIYLLAPEDDDMVDEVVTVGLGSATSSIGAPVNISQHIGNGQVTLLDNDVPDSLTIEFTSSSVAVQEFNPPLEPVLRLSGPARRDITVTLTLTDGTAVRGEDYLGDAVRTVTISAPKQIYAGLEIDIVNTDAAESDETFTIAIDTASLPAGVTGKAGGNLEATATILNDDDPPPTVSIGGSPSSITEGGTATFTLTASPAPTQDIVVAVTVAGGSFATGGDRTVTVGTSGTASFTVPTTDDTTDEPNGTITATVNTGVGYTRHGTERSASVTVNDNDNPGSTTPVASFGSATSSTAEDGGTQNVRVNLSPAPQSAITVAYTVGGTATAGTDFSIANSGSVQVAANVTSVSIPVTITEDTDDEANETVILTLGSGTGYRVGSGNVHTLTITDNDDPGPDTPVVSITASPSSMTEGDTATFTLTASPAPTEDISVQVEVTDSGDFASGGAGPQTVSIPPLGTASFTVVTTDDDTDEPNGTITVTVDTGTGYSPHNTEGSASVTVNDNDNPGSTTPVASFGSATSSAGEDGGTRNVAVNLSPAPQSAITLSYTVGGTATAGTDFSIANSGSVQVAANVTSVSIPVTITEDTDDEANETVILTLGSGTGYRVGSGNVHTLTINDNNDPGPATPVVSITGSLPTLTEGDTATFSLTASPAPTEGIVVAVTVAGGSFATGGPRTVTVGTTGTASFTVVTTDDETDEPNGTITATVNTGTGYAPSNTEGSAAVTVNDNDDPPPTVPPTVSISSERAISEGDDAVFTLSATPAPREDLPVTVQVMDSGDFASGGAGLRTVSIPPSGTAVFTVPTTDDNTDEPNGTITATVNTGTGYLPHNTEGSASVTVNDNDVPGLRFSPSSLTVARGGSSSYTISLSTRPSEPVTVSIRVPEGSGLTVDTDPGRDGNQTTLTFRADDWNVPQRVVVTVPEHPASITLTHTATGDHYGGVTAAMTVRVAAIDPAAVRGWHVRWGRTLSQQVVDALQDRFAAVPTPPGLHLRVAGEELTRAVPLAENRQVLAKALGFETVTAEQLVEGSAFSFSPPSEDGTGPGFALWGRGALSSFRGQEDTVSQEGEVSTALVGAEWRAERWQAGAALSRSWGSGSYGGENSGEVDRSTMTGLFPYGRYALTPRLGIWAVAGWGWGQLSLQPDGTDREYQPWSKLSMTAVGLDGLLLDGGAEGLSLVSTAEVLRVRTVSEGVADLAGSEGILSRRRLGLEATRAFPLSNGAALTPSLSVGIREDGGDGETGFGLEMGAGLLWADPARGVRGELQGRSLLSHVEEEFREQGLALSFAWDPAPGNRGPSFSLSHAVGATAAGGMDALLQPTAIQVLDDAHGGQQFAAELAYGVSAFADRFTLSPGVGLVLSPDGAVYSLGWALAPYAQQAQAEPWELALQGEREQRSATTSADHSLTLRFSLLF